MVERALQRSFACVVATAAIAATMVSSPVRALATGEPDQSDPQAPVKTVVTLAPAVATSTPATSVPPVSIVLPSGSTTTTSSTEVGSVPGTSTTLTDATGRLSAEVPASWADSDLRPTIRDDGGRRPTITASPDLGAWTTGWTVPGMFLVALPPTANPREVLEAYAFTGVCQDGGLEPYNDGRFNGLQQVWSRCGGGGSKLTHAVVRSADNTYAFFLQVQGTVDEPDSFDAIIQSVAAVPGTNPGETSPIVAPPDTSGPVPEELTGAPVPADAIVVRDETTRLSVAVPADWADLNNAAGTNDDFSVRPRLTAGPNVVEFVEDWNATGLEYTAFPYRPDPYTIVQNRGWSSGCDDGGVQRLDVRGYSGVLQTWINCGGTGTRLIAVAVAPADQAATLYLEVQLPTSDDTPLRTVLATFDYV